MVDRVNSPSLTVARERIYAIYPHETENTAIFLPSCATISTIYANYGTAFAETDVDTGL